jgi:hypothetical protein
MFPPKTAWAAYNYVRKIKYSAKPHDGAKKEKRARHEDFIT